MIIATASVYVVALLFVVFSTLAEKRGTIDRLKYVAFVIASEIGYTLLVYLSPNIITSICI